MASQPDAGAVADGQPGDDRLPAPGPSLVCPGCGSPVDLSRGLVCGTCAGTAERADDRPALADADDAIGQVIRLAESWQMVGGQLDASHVTGALLAICAPWTGGLTDGQCDRLAEQLREREGEQPLPVPNDGPSMHDLAADDIRRRHPGGTAPEIGETVADLMARKQLGLERYSSLLQAGNGRDALRDLHEELLDALVYCRQWLEENDGDGRRWPAGEAMRTLYRSLMTHVLTVRVVMDTRAEEGSGRG
jgi:hypothetical protein